MNQLEDMNEMIRREIQSISALEERVAFKRLMEGVFLALYETNQQMYSDLEKRVQDELAYDVNRYLIKTGVVEKTYFDASHHLMSPMDESDRTGKPYTVEDIAGAIEQQKEFSLMSVLLRCDFLQVQEIWDCNAEFDGILETEESGRKWSIRVRLRKNETYLKKIGYLYQLFMKNGIPWQTVNAPYLYKIADVVLTELPDGIPPDETVKRVEVHFEGLSHIICYDMIPIWNIQKLTLNSVGFPVPCEDHKNFEHSVSIREYGTQHAYLAEDNMEIRSISQRKERLMIVSEVSEAQKWDIYIIRNAQDSKIDRYTYPVMQNGRIENFSEKFQKKWNQSIKTRAELARFIKGFGLEEYVIYQDCKILCQFDKRAETYSMNPFIEDEVRDARAQKKLLLQFRPGAREPWLQRDVASFLVSEVQRIYPEYECGGMII
ncbi:MAG: hypothetical protein HFG46_00195 [Clostridium sp.]|jgi:hypothetical protein|nr:hypothetical protein [Clostridium sp.]